MNDYFGISDRIRSLTAPAGLEAVHQSGFSWARAGTTWQDTTRVGPEDWNRIIGNFRSLLSIEGVDLSDLTAADPTLLREALTRSIVVAAPALLLAQHPQLIDGLVADQDFLDLVAAELAGNTTIVQPRSVNLDLFASVAPTAAGLAILDDANADAQLATLGGGAAGIDIFKAILPAQARAVTEPSIILSQMDASGVYDKWVAAIAVMNAAGGGTMIIDANAPIDQALPNLAASNIVIRGSHPGITLTPSIPMDNLTQVTGSNVRFEDLTIAISGNFTSQAISHTGAGLILRNVTIFNNAATGAVSAVTCTATSTGLALEDCYIHTIGGNALTVSDGAKRASVIRGRHANIAGRSVYIGSITADVEDVLIDGLRAGETAGATSIIGSAYTVGGAFRNYRTKIVNCNFDDPNSVINAGDTILLQAAVGAYVGSNFIRRRSDVGVSITHQSTDCIVGHNDIQDTDFTGVVVGASNAGGAAYNTLVAANRIRNCGHDRNNSSSYHGALAAIAGSGASFVGNHIEGLASLPYELFLNGATDVSYWGNSSNGVFATSRIGLYPATTNSFRRLDGAFAGEPPMKAGAPAGQTIVYDTTAQKHKVWNGTSFERVGGRRFYANVNSAGGITASENVASCNHSGLGTYVYTLSQPLSSTEVVVNVMTENGAASRDIEPVIDSTTQITLNVFSSGSTKVDLGHRFEIRD